MAFIISHRGARRNSGDGDGGDYVPKPFPLPVTIYAPSIGVVNVDDPTRVPIWTDIAIPVSYQVPNLIYIVFRNGVEQTPNKDFTVVNGGTLFRFVREFIVGGDEYLRLYAYGFSL